MQWSLLELMFLNVLKCFNVFKKSRLDFVSRLFGHRIKYILFIKVIPENIPGILWSYNVPSGKGRTVHTSPLKLSDHGHYSDCPQRRSCVWGLKFNLMNKPTFFFPFWEITHNITTLKVFSDDRS